MKGKIFIDTNIFVYTFDHVHKDKSEKSRELISNALNEANAVISNQVIQEFIHVATGKFEIPMSVEDCRQYVEKIMFPMWEVSANQSLIFEALDIKQRWKYGFCDSLIIAAALQTNCAVLYTEDMQADQDIWGLKIINPFVN